MNCVYYIYIYIYWKVNTNTNTNTNVIAIDKPVKVVEVRKKVSCFEEDKLTKEYNRNNGLIINFTQTKELIEDYFSEFTKKNT